MQQSKEDLDELDESIKQLRQSYEKYFMGIDRTAPAKDHEQVRKHLRRLMGERAGNTARRFRLYSLQSTLITFEQYWTRVCRQIEEGTYRRDKLRAQRRLAEEPAKADRATADMLDASDDAEAALANLQPVAAPPPVRKAAPVSAPADTPKYPPSIVKLHEAYDLACRRVGQKNNVTMDALAKTVRTQVAALKERYKCERVEFKVVVKDGKAILKAVPKV